MAVDHKGLVAHKPEAVTRTHRLHFCHQRAMLGPFVDGEGSEQRTIGDPRQMLGFLRGTAAARQRASREHRCGKKRRRHQVAADLLHHHAGLNAAQTAAAEILRHQQAGKTHLGERPPEVAGKSGVIVAVSQLPQMRDRRLVADKAARAIAQHRLFFAEDECHGIFPFGSHFLVVIPGRCEASNPESRDSGSGPLDHPGMTGESSSPRQIENPFGHDP